MQPPLSVVMLGATGAVGGQAVRALALMPGLERLTLLGRRPLEGLAGPAIAQHSIDIFSPASYAGYLPGHRSALCTLGVGEPSRMSRQEFLRIDRDAVLAFAAACRAAGVAHFELLGAVGANARSRSLYLRTKGEIEEGLKALGFPRLSLFQPAMILTPTNRYGLSQAIILAVMPVLNPLLAGPLRKYRGIRVERLGASLAANLVAGGPGVEALRWDDFMALSAPSTI